MKQTTTKILAVFLALTMIFGLSVSATAAAPKMVEAEIMYAGSTDDVNTFNIDIDGNFIGFNNANTEEGSIELYILNDETGEYDYLRDLPAEFIFNSYSSTDTETTLDITEIYIDHSDIEISEESEYAFVVPEGFLKTADGSVNAEVGLILMGSDILEPAYEPTAFDQFIDWLSSIPYIGVILARPILVLASFFEYIFSFTSGGGIAVG